jgi:hypothetical protein
MKGHIGDGGEVADAELGEHGRSGGQAGGRAESSAAAPIA